MNPNLTPAELARHIELTPLRADLTARQLEQLCAEAREHAFAAVCVNTSRLELARHLLEESSVKVAALVAFPLGAMDADVKRYETEMAVDFGAQEIDVALNVGRFKDGDDSYVLRELRDIVEAADERPVKVIVEAGLLTPAERDRLCPLILDAGVEFVKTTSGFGAAGTTVEVVSFFRAALGEKFGLVANCAAGDLATATALLAAGATRVGIASGLKIVPPTTAAQ
jgi:deoxyribose-phosphate aldolase